MSFRLPRLEPVVIVRTAYVCLATVVGLTVIDLACLLENKGSFAEAVNSPSLVAGHTLWVLLLGVALLALRDMGDWLGRCPPLARWPTFGKALARSIVVALAALPGGYLLASELGSGGWISRQSFASVFRIGVLLGVVGGATTASLLVSLVRGRWFAALLVVLSVVLGLANGLLMSGLYPAVHVALYALQTIGMLVGLTAWFGAMDLRTRWKGAVGLVAVVIGLSAGFVAMHPATRASGARLSPALALVTPLLFRPSHEDLLLRAISEQVEVPHKVIPRAEVPRKMPIKNVIVLVVDAMRADVLPPVRARTDSPIKPGDMPFMDEKMKSAVVFSNAYAQASKTNLSMPSAFHSAEVFDDSNDPSSSLTARVARHGFTTRAVVPDWFFLGVVGRAGPLLDSFANVSMYNLEEQERFVPLSKEALGTADGDPFFAWLHYFGLHEPYFTGKRNRGPSRNRYRRASRYMDEQLRLLFSEIEIRGLAQNTLIVLMADHGELLGEGGLTHHGHGVSEAETHTPLAMWFPGAKPQTIEALSGNIDVVPTIFDLIGLKGEGHQAKGVSLASAMQAKEQIASRTYYTRSGPPTQSGLISQSHRLVYYHDLGHFELFDRSAYVPTDDVMGRDPVLDARLLREFVQRDVTLFARDASSSEVQEAAIAKINKLVAEAPSPQMEFLVNLIVLGQTKEGLLALDRLLERTASQKVRTTLLRLTYKSAPSVWRARAETWLKEAMSPEDEAELVLELKLAKLHKLDSRLVSSKLEAISAECNTEKARAWLALMSERSKADQNLNPLGEVLACAEREDPDGRTGLLVAALNALQPKGEPVGTFDLFEKVLIRLAQHQSEAVAVAACKLLRVTGSPEAREILRDPRTLNRGARLQFAALDSLGKLEGTKLTPFLVDLGEDSDFLVPILETLKDVGDERATPFLEGVIETEEQSGIKNRAKRALNEIKQRSRG